MAQTKQYACILYYELYKYAFEKSAKTKCLTIKISQQW